jgi:4-amino-4-deoxy-L-arabinose transferase-like glycosyltransferase
LTTHENDAVRLPSGQADITGQPSEAGELQRSSVAAAVIEPGTLPLPRSALETIPPQASRATSHRRRGGTRRWPWRRLAADPWPLLGILAVQAVLSVRLFWTNTAFQDEALYLWSGHLEWANWLHGARLPTSFPTFLSGAPVVYPPLGAIADSIGGLAGARALSLCFMLGATTLLFGVTRRIFDRRAALFAAGLFAGTGSVQFLGALATYDAMALFLLALATWLGVRAADARPAGRYLLLVGTAVALAVADATKYAAMLFDPVAIAVTMLFIWQRRGRRSAVTAAAVTVLLVGLLLGAALMAGGPRYLHGIEFTTFARGKGTSPAPGILFVSGKWVGAVAGLAVVGAAVLSFRENAPVKALAWSLAIAVLLAPAEQARIHVITSLFKHVAYGAWFGCVVAGYGIAALASAVPPAKIRAAVRTGVAAVLVFAVPGVVLASFHFSGWPAVTPLIKALRSRLPSVKGPMLMDDSSVEDYYLGKSLNWHAVTSNYYFAYGDPRTGRYIAQPAAAYAAAIQNRYFSLIAMSYSNDASGYDQAIRSAVAKYGGYQRVLDVPFRTSADTGYFMIWIRRSPWHRQH